MIPHLLLLLFISSIVFFSSFFRHPDIKVIYFPTPFSFHLFILLLCHAAKNKKWNNQFHHRSPGSLIAVISAVWGASRECPSPGLIFHLIDYNEQLPISAANTHLCEHELQLLTHPAGVNGSTLWKTLWMISSASQEMLLLYRNPNGYPQMSVVK